MNEALSTIACRRHFSDIFSGYNEAGHYDLVFIIATCAANVRFAIRIDSTMTERDRLPNFRESDGLSLFVADLRSWAFASQAAAARYFGRNHSTVLRYESGKVKPPLDYLLTLAHLVARRMEQIETDPAEYRNALLYEVNRAVVTAYPDADPLASWSDLYLGTHRCASTEAQPGSGHDDEPTPQLETRFSDYVPSFSCLLTSQHGAVQIDVVLISSPAGLSEVSLSVSDKRKCEARGLDQIHVRFSLRNSFRQPIPHQTLSSTPGSDRTHRDMQIQVVLLREGCDDVYQQFDLKL